jgi:hypothetical protein
VTRGGVPLQRRGRWEGERLGDGRFGGYASLVGKKIHQMEYTTDPNAEGSFAEAAMTMSGP